MSSSSTIPSIATYSSPVNLLYLPDDLLLNCVARVSRLHYPSLSLVSKRFCSLVASKELYETRKLIGCTESCLYVCIRSAPPERNPRWFTLSLRPTRTPNPRWFNLWWTPTPTLNPKLKHTLVSVPSRNYSPKFCWDVTAVGSDIYMIGEDNSLREPSSRVFIMDCQSHTWREGPSMLVARGFPEVKVHDGKIYVVGGTKSSMWTECFDPKTQKWKDVTSPDADMRVRDIRSSVSMEGNLYLVGDEKKLVYKPKEDKWDVATGSEMVWDRGSFSSICVIDDVLISHGSSGILKWYDFEGRAWRVLKGLEKLDKLVKYYSRVEFFDYGGKIAVLLDVHSVFGYEEIWCAEISLVKGGCQEIYGKIEWCDLVLKVPKSSFIDNFILVTV